MIPNLSSFEMSHLLVLQEHGYKFMTLDDVDIRDQKSRANRIRVHKEEPRKENGTWVSEFGRPMMSVTEVLVSDDFMAYLADTSRVTDISVVIKVKAHEFGINLREAK